MIWLWAAVASAYPRVTGGEVVDDPGRWPGIAALHGEAWGEEGFVCTGVLVAPDVVLTASHCLDDIDVTSVVLGAIEAGGPGETIPVRRTQHVVDWWAGGADLGIVVLEGEAATPPAPLTLDCLADELVDGAPVGIVGFGAHDEAGTEWDGRLRQAYSAVHEASCSSTGDGCFEGLMPGGELTAGGGGVDACYGDSGGPLYLDTAEGLAVAGITSRAYAWISVDAPCRDGGIWVRPDAFVDWIEEAAGRSLPRPVCGGATNHAPEPTVGDLAVVEGGEARVTVDPDDPDRDQGHTFRIVEVPALGEAVVQVDGTVVYRAADDVAGRDAVVVEVRDDGEPARTARVTVDVFVLEELPPAVPEEETPVATGCQTTPGAPWWLGLWLMWRRAPAGATATARRGPRGSLRG